MTQEEQRIYYEKALADAIGEYKHVSCLVDAIRMCVTDIDFEEKFPVSQERYLLVEKMKTSEGVQTNLRNSIRFYREMLKANNPEPWEENNALRTVGTPCGPVRVVNTDKVPNLDMSKVIHHCGLDAEKPRETISFDGSECEHPAEEGASLQDIMAQIRKDTDDFMNYLEAIVKTQE